MSHIIARLFKKKPNRPSSLDIKTHPLSEEQLRSVTHESAALQPVHYLAGCGQSVGMQRDHNEDTLFFMNTLLADGVTDIPFGIFLVADGMGGHQHGEIASAVAARSMAGHLMSHVYNLFLALKAGEQTESLQEVMEAGVAEAQRAVSQKAPGGGTTLTAAVAIGDQLTIAHVGDSRAYLIFPDGRMQAVTQDHSLVQRLMELGQITEEEARVHPQRNVLYRAVGQADPLRPDVKTHQFPRGGYLLVCSDGLWGVVPEEDIFRIIRTSASPDQACQKLVDTANEFGGPDNISAVLVSYPA